MQNVRLKSLSPMRERNLSKRKSVPLLLAALASTFYFSTASAQFNKCVGKDGKIIYTDGPCSSGTSAAKGYVPAPTIVLPELTWDKQIFAHWCVERWNDEASPRARANQIAALYRQAEQGGDKVKEHLRQQGLSLAQAVNASVDSEVQKFNTDCAYFGFKKVDGSTDHHNEQVSRALKRTLETKYPGSKSQFERSRGR